MLIRKIVEVDMYIDAAVGNGNHVSRRSWEQTARALTLFLAAALLPGVSVATEREAITTIKAIYSYTQFGGGDVMVQVASPPAGCTKGFWLSGPNDPGFKATYALLISAYHAQSTVRIGGDDAQLWSGSGDVYCRLTFAAVI